jgi:hypothetical protein
MKYPYVVGLILDHFPGLSPEDVIEQLRSATFVSLARRYAYFSVPKAACTMMKELLRTVENAPPIKLFADGMWETRRDMFVHARSNVPLPSLVDLDDATQSEILNSPEFFRMTVVRNPYMRLLSAWKSKIMLCEPPGRDVYLQIKGSLPHFHNKSLVSFDEFVEYLASRCHLRTCNPHWRPQVDLTFFPVLNFSCVAKMEQLGEGLRLFEQHIGLPGSAVVDRRNVSVPDSPAGYTRELAEKVHSLYRKDFELLGYDGNSWADGGQNSNESKSASIDETKFHDEIIERNLIISSLYEERDKLQTQLQRLSMLNPLSLPLTVQKVAQKAKRWAGRTTHPRRVGGGHVQ